MIRRLPLPDFKPDQSNNSGVLLTAKGVFRAIDGYRSVGSVTTVSDSLPEVFMGGASAIAADGTAYLLAGTDTHLYRLDADGSWTSLIGSLTITERWKFVQFGDYSVAVNGGPTLEVDLGAATASAIVGAPTFTSIAVVGDHVVGGQANGAINVVRWSAFRDHTGWTIGTNQSGEQPMQTGGSVMGVCGGEYGIILQRERIVRMEITGDSSAPFTFNEISSNFGCSNGQTIAQAGRSIFFHSDRGFMALDDGQALKPIGSEKVDRTFAAAVSRDDLGRIYTAVDPENKLVMWMVPGTPGTIWVYNFELDGWTTIEVSAKGLFPGFTTSTGIDDLSAIYGNIDTLPYSLDDPRWSGGNPRLYLVTTADAVGNMTGEKLEAVLELGYNQFAEGERARVNSIRPVTDATTGLSLTMNAKARLGDNDNLKTAASLTASGIMPIRAAGRYIATKLTIAAGTDWEYVQALEINFEAGGMR